MLVSERIMPAAKKYRELADECLGWAVTAKSDQDRRIFLRSAEFYLGAATRADCKAKAALERGFAGRDAQYES